MEGGEEVRQLLTEIRDLEREHLAEYRKVSAEILSIQRVAVDRQALFGRVYKRIVLLGSVMILALTILLVYLLAKWWGPLFGR